VNPGELLIAARALKAPSRNHENEIFIITPTASTLTFVVGLTRVSGCKEGGTDRKRECDRTVEPNNSWVDA